MAAKKILLVEDDRTVQLLLKTVLEKAGYQVLSALDGMQGIMMARQQTPDLIILDLMMPAGGGASVLDRVRTLATTMSTPVLVYSAMPDAERDQKVQTGPITKVLKKPAPPAEILAAVQSLLGA